MWMFAAAVLVLLVVSGVISYPLLVHGVEPYAPPGPPDAAFDERDALLDALSDLEESYHSGKLSEDDYAAQRQRLELQYLSVLEQPPPGA